MLTDLGTEMRPRAHETVAVSHTDRTSRADDDADKYVGLRGLLLDVRDQGVKWPAAGAAAIAVSTLLMAGYRGWWTAIGVQTLAMGAMFTVLPGLAVIAIWDRLRFGNSDGPPSLWNGRRQVCPGCSDWLRIDRTVCPRCATALPGPDGP
jgi:hypothetical protein